MALHEGLNSDEPPTGVRRRKSGANGENKRLGEVKQDYVEDSRPQLRVVEGAPKPEQPEFQPPTYDELMSMYSDLELNMAIMAEEREGLQLQLRQAGRKQVQLQKEINDIREADPKGLEIKEIVDYWKKRLGHPKIKFSIHDGRADIVRKALKHRDKDELLKAIDGLALLPYVGPQGRTSNPNGATRHDRLGLVFKDVETIDRFISYAERADNQAERNADRLFDKYQELQAHADMYMNLVMNALAVKEGSKRGGWTEEEMQLFVGD